MRSNIVRCLIVIVPLMALPVTSFAQEASVTGTITDATGAVLPGVTVTAIHKATGNMFVAVSDERGTYRLPLRTGGFQITAELPGFSTATREVELLLGQQGVINLQLSPSGVAESITVSGEAPLIDPTQSRPAGNIDPRQMEALPVNGRNWLDLTVLAPGSRTNDVTGDRPIAQAGHSQGNYQINVDGQQVTNNLCCGTIHGNPHFSRDAIAEFEVVSNRFDATQGRSGMVQVNAVTKSGTNISTGTLSGYFRNSRFNAPDFVRGQVLPYSNQQLSTTFGGPIRKDKIHIFGYYEYEREPQTNSYTPPYPRFNIDLRGTRKADSEGLRMDLQKSAETRFSVRFNRYHQLVPFVSSGSSTNHPASSGFDNAYNYQVLGTATKILSNRSLNELRVGYVPYWWNADSILPGPNWHPEVKVRPGGGPTVTFRGYSISPVSPQTLGTNGPFSARDDFSYSFNKFGRHDLKTGAEFLYSYVHLDWCLNCNPTIDANVAPIPSNIEDLFPVWNDPGTWNLAAISPITVRYRQSIGTYIYSDTRKIMGTWLQDDWQLTKRFTLNLGVRYDPEWGGLAEHDKFLPFLSGNRPSDLNNVAPRLGFAYSVNDRTVVRGGWGKYFGEVEQRAGEQAKINILVRIPETPNDGRPDFAANPYNGARPSFDQVQQRLCPNNPAANCLRHDVTSAIPSPSFQVPFGYQASLGMQRQFTNTMALDVDYTFTGTRADQFIRNINVGYNPATGTNYPFTDISHRPYPDWGIVNMLFQQGISNYHAVTTTLTKRLSQRWQASATYTLSKFRDEQPAPVNIVSANGLDHDPIEVPLGFKVSPDLGGEYTLAPTDQRHRAVFNGIWDIGQGFQLSGLYFYSSGLRYVTNYGGDLRNLGGGGEQRLRPDGTIVPRNNLVGSPLHRVDMRIQRRFPLGGHAGVDGILEVFNVFNHANYGSYTTQESNRLYGQPSFNSNVAYQPRMLQLGFRFAF